MVGTARAAPRTLHFDPWSADTRGSMMLRPAALALLTITLAALQGAQVSEAITFPTIDLSCFAWCADDPLQNNGDLRLLPAREREGAAAASAIATCADRDAPECTSRESKDHWEKTQQGERYFDAMLSTENKVEPKDSR